jgi:queuosine precursor transporter
MINTPAKLHKYYSILALFFLAANITYFSMSPRIMNFHGLLEPGGILIFPFTFFFLDVITEVYGYQQARQLIWISVICLCFFVTASHFSMKVPSAVIDRDGIAFETVFSKYPKAYLGIGSATVISFLTNSYILAKLKILAKGRLYWLRSIFSTAVGHAIFSLTWAIIFYSGMMSFQDTLRIAFNIYGLKLASEFLLTPFSATLAAWLKFKEGVDVFDYKTNFTFFSLRVESQ